MIMKRTAPVPHLHPTIVKYTQHNRSGIQADTLHRHAIGYVLHGKRYLYRGDSRQEIEKGSVYYLRAGNHYIEDVPEPGKTFEQILFFYDILQINKILNHLSFDCQLEIANNHRCPNCHKQNEVVYPAWNTLDCFFNSVNQYLADGVLGRDSAAENIKMTELVYLLLSNRECCLQQCILSHIDASVAGFDQTIHDHIFSDITIEELAQKCNRSLTSFKKEFKKHFNEPPHKWFVRHRLMHARLQLLSTGKSVAEIGIECNFPNTSHFIKLFKKEYKQTPVAYRHSHTKGKTNPIAPG